MLKRMSLQQFLRGGKEIEIKFQQKNRKESFFVTISTEYELESYQATTLL